MEILKILWTTTFFFFTLILIFIWSKIIVVSNKLKAVSSLVAESEKIEFGETEEETAESGETPVENNWLLIVWATRSLKYTCDKVPAERAVL